MDNMKLLRQILDIGCAMIQSGAETHRVEDSLYRLCDSYGFTQCNVWVVPTNIQATVTTSDGSCITQIRHVRHIGVDFHRLDELNELSRYACAKTPGVEEFSLRLKKIENHLEIKPETLYFAGALASAGFGIFFNCDMADTLTAIIASFCISFLGRKLSAWESNPMIQNLIIAFFAELVIISLINLGLGHHLGYITVAVVMLLISALGTTNGVRDFVHLDTLSGIMNISTSLSGAIGIAIGIVLPLLLFHTMDYNEITFLNPQVCFQLLGCTLGCTGFALWFHVRGSKVISCAVGAFLTWTVYSLVYYIRPSTFFATLVAATTCAAYAQVLARVHKAPATIFQTISVFPLIPGATLYYMMYGFIIGDLRFAFDKGLDLVLTCFAIVFGFLAIEVAGKCVQRS